MGKWIYYVEDDTSIRELVLYALKTAEFQVMGFENAASFYKRMKEQQPDLILLDIMLPDEDGVSILKKLKSRPDTENIPVIMMTAKSSEYDKVLGLDSGERAPDTALPGRNCMCRRTSGRRRRRSKRFYGILRYGTCSSI